MTVTFPMCQHRAKHIPLFCLILPTTPCGRSCEHLLSTDRETGLERFSNGGQVAQPGSGTARIWTLQVFPWASGPDHRSLPPTLRSVRGAHGRPPPLLLAERSQGCCTLWSAADSGQGLTADLDKFLVAFLLCVFIESCYCPLLYSKYLKSQISPTVPPSSASPPAWVQRLLVDWLLTDPALLEGRARIRHRHG